MKYTLIAAVIVLILGGAYVFLSEDQLYTPMRADVSEEEYDDSSLVLQYDADSVDECDAGDTFNSEEGVCEYVCSSEAECNSLAQDAEGELESWGDTQEKDTMPVAEKPSSESDLSALYAVDTHEHITLESGNDAQENQEIWEKVAALAPDAFTAQYIETFGVFSDAQNDTLAYVDDEDGNGKWRVVVNVVGYNDSTDRERALTLIHELGHVVTLNSSQVDAAQDEASCNGFFTGEGCARAGTYIADFVSAFWPSDDVVAVGGGAGQEQTDLFATKPTAFVSEYASTNPGEDIAESFAQFVLDPKNPSPASVAQQKVAFFYTYAPLVSFRSDMRTALVTGIVRAKRRGGE